MAAPNIVNVSNITGKTAVMFVTTSAQDLITNAANSNKVLKLNSLTIANVNGTAAASVTVSIFRSSSEYKLAHTVFVPANSTLVVVSKDSGIYLEEGDSLRIVGSANNYLHAVCGYESIS
jgi:hypothetical protein